jgi:putative ABC transport system substrate-binding protein
VFLSAFRQGMLEKGYIEGRNIIIEYRYVQGVVDRFPALVDELIRLKVDVLVVGGTLAAQSAKAATATVPIVFTLVSDPVGAGLVASLARPGGNATGLSNIIYELSATQLQVLKEAVPKVSRVAVLHNPLNSGRALNTVRDAARALGVELQVLEVRQPPELASAFSALTARHADAVLALSDPVFGNEVQLSNLAAANRLPAMYATREFAEAGGLLAYGPNFPDNYRRAASYVDRILKGAQPGDLPVEQPTRFEFVINLKTAKALGLTIPQSLLQRADQLIQ